MSIILRLRAEVRCNDCNYILDSFSCYDLNDAVDRLRLRHWAVGRDGKTYCPECAPRHRRTGCKGVRKINGR